MDQQAARLLDTLKRTAATAESKLALLNTLKSDIKHYRVPENAQPTIFECLKTAISQQTSSSIATAAFSTLGHLVKRLKIQDAEGHSIAAHAPRLWPALLERLGDPRENNRSAASQAYADLWPYCTQDVERIMREDAISGNNVRAKETGMQWVVTTHQDANLQFKSFVPCLVVCLEDANEGVRDAAKNAVVELFRTAPDRAKADLKKQLTLHSVRRSITSQILTQIGASSTSAPEVDLAASTRSMPALDHLSQFAESLNSEEAKPPPPEEVPMDPIFVHSHRELEDTFRDMLPHFEGRELEENWSLRDKDIMKLRRMTKGNAPSEYHAAYMAGLKQMQDGILKAANSLRTTFSSNGCQLVQELARSLGPALDSMAEIYLQSFIKMCAGTKQIAAQAGNLTVDTIFQYVSYHIRLMQHIWSAAQDKNKQTRMFSAGWLRTLLSKQAGSKSHFESSGGLDLAEKTIKRCLEDADPKVKESMRATYWTFARNWPDHAIGIMNTLDAKAKTALEKDSHNPNSASSAARPTGGTATTARASGARSALRDRIAADKAARAARNQPPRPNTAMAAPTASPAQSRPHLGSRAKTLAPPVPSRVVSTTSTTSTGTAQSVESTPSSSSAANMRPNSLMSGMARRPISKREMPRPATADPYASRAGHRPETPSNRSPASSPRQSTTSRPTAPSTSARNRVSRMDSPAASPLRHPASSRTAAVPRPSSSRDGHQQLAEDLTIGALDEFNASMPRVSNRDAPPTVSRRRPGFDKSMSVDSGIPAIEEDDNFTMEMPNMRNVNSAMRERSPLTYRSPIRSISEEASHVPLPVSARSSTQPRSPPQPVGSPKVVRSPAGRRVTPERSDTPNAESATNGVARQGSPLKASAVSAMSPANVQIYEDPFTGEHPSNDTSAQPVGVLNELPLNESSQPSGSPEPVQSPTASANGNSPHAATTNGVTNGSLQNGTLSPPRSPQSKAETMRSRKLLQSGIERIRARTLDTHGFRKVLDLTRTNDPTDLFGAHYSSENKRYDDLMGALCEYVTLPPDSLTTSAASRQAQNQPYELKRQALNLLKTLLGSPQPAYKKWNNAWYSRTLTATLETRKTLEGMGMVVKDLEMLVAESVKGGRREEVLDTVIAFLERTELQQPAFTESTDASVFSLQQSAATKTVSHATALGLRTLTSCLSLPSANSERIAISEEQKTRTVSLVASYLRSRDAEIRKADVELATQLHAIWLSGLAHTNGDRGSEERRGFWNALEKTPGGLQESTKNLIVYFIARREGRVDVR